MSRQQDGPLFNFHGNAMPFGARIDTINDKPAPDLIQGPPAAALAVVGGWSVATATGSRCHDVFKWGATVADCKGESLGGQHFRTTVMSSIGDVWIKNDPIVFEARQLRIRVVSDHPAPAVQPSIVPTETLFDGLLVGGDSIMVPYDDDLISFPTFEKFEAQYKGDQDFYNKYQGCLKHPQGSTPKHGDDLPRNEGGYVVMTFVRNVVWRERTYQGNILPVKGFGNIHFGEVLMKEDTRRITMVRLEMGCSVQADCALAEVDHNGNY